ncbi:hypothetical protein WDU94_011315 [Cyamophila willieti]
MSARSEAMSQDEDNQGVIKTHMITMDNGQNAADAMYIVHHVPEDQIDQIHQHLEVHNQSEDQVIEMNEFIQLKQDIRSKMKGKSRLNRTAYKKIKREVDDTPKNRHKNFSDTWLLSSVFKHWLERHPSSNTKAICKVCNKVLLAGKSELLKHGASKKHLQFMQATTGWKNDIGEEGYENSADVSSDKESNCFDEEWLEDPLFKDWISSHPDSPYKAFCKACNKVILATKSQLIKHRTQKKHRDCMKTSGLEDTVDISASVMDTFDDNDAEETPDYTLEEADNYEHEPTESQPEDTPYKVFRVKPTKSASTPYTSGGGTSSKLSTVEEEAASQAVVTQPAPSWKGKAVVNGHVKEISLSDYKGRYLVMFFYPQDFSTVCSTEILALGDVLSAFRVINCEIVAVSVDSHLAHLAWTKTLTGSTSHSRPAIDSSKIVPLLSDSTHSISKTYGCYQPSVGHSLRAYYIIDKRGYLRAMSVSDIQVGRNLKEILRLVEAFQLVDSTDTQCPVNWTTGQPSVKVAL